MAYEFGFDVVRLEIEELETAPDEAREFVIEAMAGDVAAHINVDSRGMGQILAEIEREQQEAGYRPGGAWEPQLPQMRGFFFHPRIVMSVVQAIGPHDGDEEADFWEFVFDDDDGSQVVLRMSETVTQRLQRLIESLLV